MDGYNAAAMRRADFNYDLPDRLSPADLGVIRFPALVGLDHAQARDRVSDHAPVYLALHGGRLASLASGDAVAVMAARCVDLNDSSPAELEGLPHVGPARAAAIVAGRPWHDAAELTRIRGIAGARLAEIRDSGRLCEP